jgi:hypothetical protein
MSIELLHGEFVTNRIKERGLKRNYVITQLGLGGDGYRFLRGEWMPKNRTRKARLLSDLAKLLGVEVPQILLRFEAKKNLAS